MTDNVVSKTTAKAPITTRTVFCIEPESICIHIRVFQNLDFGSDPAVPLDFGAPII